MTLFSLAGSPDLANRTPLPESGLVKMMSATCGPRCLGLFGRFPQNGLWAKMFSALLIGQEGWFSRRCKLIWSVKVTKYNRTYFQLRVLTLHTNEIGSGLLLTEQNTLLKTPTKMDGEVTSGKANPVSGDSGTLAQEIMSGHPPTMQKLGLLPTPASSNYKGSSSVEALEARGRLKEKADNLADQFAVPGKTSQLNPQFVLEMMGFPPDWTLLPFLSQSGETNQSKLPETP